MPESAALWRAASWEQSWAGATGGLAGGISGGISASMQGRNFWTGAKPELTNHELIQQAADMAYKEVPGSGPVVGTKRHEYATKYLEEYQRLYGDRGLVFKYRFSDNLEKQES